MIFVDLHGILIANIMVAFLKEVELDEGLVRHMILHSLRKINQKHRGNGRIIISCDSKKYWRKEVFPYYKIKRKESLDKSNFNWREIHEYMDKIKGELKDNFLHWSVMEIDGAESDDIIATLVKRLHKVEEIIIVSSDKDFSQLQKYPGVRQYDPRKEEGDSQWIVCENPESFLFEHICIGDAADSIPNVVSGADSIALGVRQKPMLRKKIEVWKEEGVPQEILPRFEQNKIIIDFQYIPKDIEEKIIKSFKESLNTNPK